MRVSMRGEVAVVVVSGRWFRAHARALIRYQMTLLKKATCSKYIHKYFALFTFRVWNFFHALTCTFQLAATTSAFDGGGPCFPPPRIPFCLFNSRNFVANMTDSVHGRFSLTLVSSVNYSFCILPDNGFRIGIDPIVFTIRRAIVCPLKAVFIICMFTHPVVCYRQTQPGGGGNGTESYDRVFFYNSTEISLNTGNSLFLKLKYIVVF